MAFPQRFLDELSARNDIVDVVNDYVHLTSKGGRYWACCPFHNEKTPSFCVQQDKQLYYCFGCKKGGSVIQFVMEMEHLNFPEAVRFLAKRARMEVPEEDEYGQAAARQRTRLLSLNRDTARFYYEVLQQPEGQSVREYLNRRQIRRKTAMNFGMGAAPDSWDSLIAAMTAKGYSKSELLTAGLIVQGKNGGLYDKFRNRLMLPVVDTRGDVVAFGSRVLDQSEPKYMNSPETPVYSKRQVLYGLNLAKKSRRRNIILCEGNLDIVTLHQAGFDNAVASMGTALTEEQIKLLSRFTKELVLCYDNDEAGESATEKALDLLNRSSFHVRVLQLPRRRTETGELVKQDADDFIKYQGADAFETLLSGSENGMEFRMAQIAGKYDLSDDAARAAYCIEAAERIAALDSPAERDIYTGRASETAGVSRDTMRQEVERFVRQRRTQAQKLQRRKELNPVKVIQPQERSLQYSNIRSARAEEGILRLLLLDDSLFPSTDSPPVRSEQFSSELLGKAYDILWRARSEGRTITIAALSGALEPAELSHIAAVCQQPESESDTLRKKALYDYISIIQEESQRQTDSDRLRAVQERKKKKGGTRL